MKNIILIGMPGSGKSSLAKILSQKLNLKYIDIDLQIEKEQNKSIPQIFSDHGEKYFRECERKAIKKILSDKNLIIATGGGTPIYKNNSCIIKNFGIVIYLYCSPRTIYEHLIKDKNFNSRPLIKKNFSQIKNLYQKRNNIYNSCCDFVLKCDKKNLDYLSNKLFSLFSFYIN